MYQSKLAGFGTTIFTTMTQLCLDYKAINLAQGFPDFPASERLIALVNQAMVQGKNQYVPMAGTYELREQIAEKTEELYGFAPDPVREITVTCGATEACYTAITAFVHPGDEVIVFEPAFDSYVPAIELCGGKAVFVPLVSPDFHIPWEKVREKLTAATRMLILNSPHNPTGAAYSSEDLMQLQELVKGTNVLIISDEVYEHILFDGRTHESVLKYPALRERSVVVSSFGKTFHTTGWRLGYAVAPPDLSIEFRKLHQYITFCAPAPFQIAVAEFLKERENYLTLSAFYQEKRDYFLDLMRHSRFEALPSSGTYFQLFSYKRISDQGDVDFAVRLTKEAGVGSIPISVFYHTRQDDKFLRFCFAKEPSTLEKAAEKLCKL